MKRNADELRNFGLLVGGIFGFIGVWPMVWHQNPRVWALTIAVALITPALLAPRVLAPVHRVWMKLGEMLGWVNTRAALGVVFFGVVTPIGLVMRMRGHDPMRRRLEPDAESYRVCRERRPAAHMMRQF